MSDDTLYDGALDLLNQRGMKFIDRFMPPFLCSFAAHTANIENYNRKFYKEYDTTPDWRLHIIFVAPPGYGKSFMMKQLLNETYGVLNSGQVPMKFEGFSSEAGMIGSTERSGGKSIRIEGVFEEYKEGIIAFEEFFSIMQSMHQTHSSHLEPALNQVLLDGDVSKRLRSGPIEYKTRSTVWAGTQTTRFTVGGGLLRRFFLMNWIPSKQDRTILRKAIETSENVHLPPKILKDYRNLVVDYVSELKHLKSVEFDNKLYDVAAEVPHHRISVLRRLALGYNLMTRPAEHDFVVEIDNKLERLINRCEVWRKSLIGDPEADLVLQFLNENGGIMGRTALKEKLIDFSMRFTTTENIFRRLVAANEVIIHQNYLYTFDKWMERKK